MIKKNVDKQKTKLQKTRKYVDKVNNLVDNRPKNDLKPTKILNSTKMWIKWDVKKVQTAKGGNIANCHIKNNFKTYN